MCEQVVAWGREGKSRAWMCSQLDISMRTLLDWEASNEDFSHALMRAEMHAQAHWEDLGHDNIKAQTFQSSVWSRSMAARFPKFWREKTAIVGGDESDSPVKQETHHTGLDEFARRIVSIAARTTENGGDEPPHGGTAG